MKTLIIFYSYTGSTRKIAQALAKRESADISEVEDAVRPGRLRAYFKGCFAAVRGTAWPIKPIKADWAAYDRIILCSPVWAGNPPPAVHAALGELPQGKAVTVKMVSASGKSGCRDRLEALIRAKGGSLEGFENIKAQRV